MLNEKELKTEELMKEVAELLGVDYTRVKWDMSKESVIEQLVKVVRASAGEISEREEYIKYVTGFPFRGGFGRGSKEES